ncbi:transposase [Peribacillus frigoritolerans]|uniref:transposase n=1 Tax=Peribacillus frigoritolerans TaxID=450367 RepID=UPI0033145289
MKETNKTVCLFIPRDRRAQRFVSGTIVTPGNTHDSQILEPLVKQVIEKVGKPEAIAADAAYKTPAITSYLFN